MVSLPGSQTNSPNWQRRIVATSNGFLQFLSGYSIFQGPIVGIMVVDYFVVRRGNLHIPELFTSSATGRYFYTKGVNVRAFAAFVVGFVLPLPGFVGSFGEEEVSAAATHLFSLGWVLSFLVGGVAYFGLCWVWAIREEVSQFEELARGEEERVEEAQQTPTEAEKGAWP